MKEDTYTIPIEETVVMPVPIPAPPPAPTEPTSNVPAAITGKVLKRTTEVIYHPDGSQTTTTTNEIENADGTVSIMKETVTPRDTVVIKSLIRGTAPYGVPRPGNSLSRWSTGVFVVAVLCSLVCTSIASVSYASYYYNSFYFYPSDGLYVATLVTTFVSMVFFIVATPLAFCSARKYQKELTLQGGNRGLMITSWVFYGIGIANWIVVFGISVSYPNPFYMGATAAWNIAAWIMMFVHCEFARRCRKGCL